MHQAPAKFDDSSKAELWGQNFYTFLTRRATKSSAAKRLCEVRLRLLMMIAFNVFLQSMAKFSILRYTEPAALRMYQWSIRHKLQKAQVF